MHKCWEAPWVILVDFFEHEPNVVPRGRHPRDWNEPNESCSHLSENGSKGRFSVPGRLEHHSNEEKAKEKKKQRGGRKNGEEEKAMVALLLFTLEPLLWDTSVQRTQKLFGEKCSHNLCTCYLYWRDTSFWRKGHFFWVSKPGFNLPWGNTLVLKKRLTTKRVDKVHSSLVKMASEFYKMSHLTKIDVLNVWQFNTQHHKHNYGIIFFLHFLAAWSNDCSTFWGTIKEKCIIRWLIIYKFQLNFHSGDTCPGREGVPLIKDV